ncbi:MAG: hypothetical protein WBZ36_26210, partial [Candidatus Nitrosopolaris sp.]
MGHHDNLIIGLGIGAIIGAALSRPSIVSPPHPSSVTKPLIGITWGGVGGDVVRRAGPNASFVKPCGLEFLLEGHKILGLLDSVTGDSTLYWKKGDEIQFGTIEDLYCKYHSSEAEKSQYKVLSLGPKNKDCIVSGNNVEPFFSDIQDASYHGIKDVWRVTLNNGKHIDVTKDHSLYAAYGHPSKMVPKSFLDIHLHKEWGIVSVDDYGFDGNMSLDNELVTLLGLWMADGAYAKNHNGTLKGLQISTGN